MNLTATLSLIEVALLCVVVPGWVSALRVFIESAEDWKFQARQSPADPILYKTARMGFRLHVAALAARTFFLCLGLRSAFQPPPPPADNTGNLITVLTFAFYTFLAILANVATILADWDRHDIKNMFIDLQHDTPQEI